MSKFKTFSTNRSNKARVFSALVFGTPALLMALFFASPTLDPPSASADSDADRTNFSFTAAPSLSISVTSDDLSLGTIEQDSQLYTASTSVSATTNSSSGCTLRIAASEDATTSLVNSEANASIPTLTSAVTIDDFSVNHWGFHSSAEAAGLYRPIPTSTSPYSVSSRNSAGTYSTTVTFGVKANAANPAGDYSTSVTFSLVVGS